MAAGKRLVDEPLPVEAGYFGSVAFSPDGKSIAAGYRTGRSDGGVMVWNMAAGNSPSAVLFVVNEGGVESVAFSPDCKTLAAGYGVFGEGGAPWCCGTWRHANGWATFHFP